MGKYLHYKLMEGDFIIWYYDGIYLKEDVTDGNWDTRYEHWDAEGDSDSQIKHETICGKLLRIIYGFEN